MSGVQPAREPADDLDIDARFLLANERTLLAWVRTSLTLLAVGAGVQQFGTTVEARRFIASALLAVAGLAALTGLLRYRRADQAIRAGRLPAGGVAPLAVTVAVVGVTVVMLVAVLSDSRA